MALAKRVELVPNRSKQAEFHGAQPKVLHLKTFDARIEKRDPLPVQVYLARLDEPRARERTITEDVSPHGARVVSSRCWKPGDVPLLTPLTGKYPKHARVIYCVPQPDGCYSVGIKFDGPSFKWTI
jgi:hypothetical protein